MLKQLNWYRYVFGCPLPPPPCMPWRPKVESSHTPTLCKSQHLLGRILAVPGDNLPTHETYHLLAPSGPRCVTSSESSTRRSPPPSPPNLKPMNERLPYTFPLPPKPYFLENSFRSRVQLGCAPGLVGRVGRRPLARHGGAIRRRRVLDACIQQHLHAPGQGAKVDDVRVGIHSMALLFGDHTHSILTT